MKSNTFLDKLAETCFSCFLALYGFAFFGSIAILFSLLLFTSNLGILPIISVRLKSSFPAIILFDASLAIISLVIFLINYNKKFKKAVK